jgi:hypothetical protein
MFEALEKCLSARNASCRDAATPFGANLSKSEGKLFFYEHHKEIDIT